MIESRKVLLTFLGLAFCVVSVSAGSPCACGPEPVISPTPVQGGIAFAGNGNGAYFSWSNYTPPVITILNNGTSTTVTTTPGLYNQGQNTNLGKFVFKNDMGLGSNKTPDLQELHKLLIAEKFMPATTSLKQTYDIQLRDAVTKFQQANGIKPAPIYPYGYFGPITRGFINNRK